ncbi:hypothetical protein BC936DRAFT_141936 [Jimgerdemannia flammicorona]|uniref:Uncharacterized protein n=1 Tax=Jimgerdemannia flammicorona TaxID=994334 RepID=A0A433DFL9_9FUNG|nr:hypothetical protein BC936DRAFT_141936 [Jimgerdemannia flammicorona]
MGRGSIIRITSESLSPIQFEFSERQWRSLVADCPNIGTTNQYNIETIIKQLFSTTSEKVGYIRRIFPSFADLNAFESNINPLAEGCHKGEYLASYITSLLQGALNIGTFCRYVW